MNNFKYFNQIKTIFGEFDFAKKGELLIIDIGTHSGTEIKSFSNSRFFFIKILKDFIKKFFSLRYKNLLKVLTYYFDLINSHLKLKKSINKISLILIEPNFLHFSDSVYKHSTLLIPCAIDERSKNYFDTSKLYIANSNKLSEGNSIFINKKNINKNNYLFVSSIKTEALINIIKKRFIKKGLKIILRINCEGAEDQIIIKLKEKFPENLVGVLGSLKDVIDIKGQKKYNKLLRFMNKNNLKFIQFSSNIFSWREAHSFIISHLK